MKIILAFSISVLLSINSFSQQTMKLTLDDALNLAQSQSLQSFFVKNTYLASYWNYISFKADYLPALSLSSQLINYSNANTLRYNSVTKTEDYVKTQTLNSSGSVYISQNIGATGGTLFLNSDLFRNRNFGDKAYTQYSSRPFRVGYRQDLFGYNSFKWKRKLEPKKYQQAMQEYLHSRESTNILTCKYFFNLILGRINYDLAKYNYSNTNMLFGIAQKRFDLGTLTKDELLELELNLNNAAIKVKESKMQYRKNKEALITFLRLPADVDIKIILPEAHQLLIPEDKALQLALERNANMIEQQVRLINAESQVARTKAQKRFQASMNVSYGINKADGYFDYTNNIPVDGEIANVYRPDFEKYQQLGVSIIVPILDWGKRKGRYKMAKSELEITKISIEQAITSFKQNVITKVMEFNLQFDKVMSRAKSDTLAKNSYELALARFKKGNIDVLKLTSSQKSKDNARIQYINALYKYWDYFYTVRKLTLHDFFSGKALEEDFNELLNY